MNTDSTTSPSRTTRTTAPTQRFLVLETSALISILSRFTDPYTHSIEPLEKLIQPPPGQSESPVIGLYIPDQVFYEFSGILPINIPRMVERFVRERNNPEGLKRAIEFYLSVSPRTSSNIRHADMNRDQLYTLFSYIAKYPECLGYDKHTGTIQHGTRTAAHYVGRLRAEHSVLGTIGMTLPENYRPTIGNVMDALGDKFNVDALRIHAGQLYMMGFFTEDEFKQRMEKEPETNVKPRFMRIADFARLLHTTKKWIPQQSYERILRKRDENVGLAKRQARADFKALGLDTHERDRRLEKVERDQNYLTVGFLKSFPHLLELYRADGNIKIAQRERGNVSVFGRGEALVTKSIRPSRMLIEHYVYGGVFPLEAIPEIARLLGFDIHHGQPTNDPRSLIHHLDKQGFFERAINTEELKQIHAYLKQQCQTDHCPYRNHLDKLSLLIESLPRAVLRVQEEFDKACTNPTALNSMKAEHRALHEVGVPYEKVFSEELINGTISFEQFFAIAQQSGCLVRVPRGEPQLYATASKDIVISYNQQDAGRKSTIWIRQSDQDVANANKHNASFVSRSGLTFLRRHYAEAGVTLPFNDNKYWKFEAGELIDRARTNRSYNGEKDFLDRCFAAILYPGVVRSASQVRKIATAQIDENTLLQMEKDFTTRHARGWLRHLPAFTNPMAALHVARRIARKNMGELATAELAVQLAEEHPDAKITIVNHDSDLFPDEQGIIQMSNDIRRMHSGRHADLEETGQKLTSLSQSGNIDFLRTDQLMDTLCVLLNHHKPHVDEKNRKREPYPGIRMRESISGYTNRDWQFRVHEPLQRLATRQR